MILSGHSGSGKSYLTSELSKAIQAQAQAIKLISPNSKGEITIHYTATTHQAAKVLSNVVGEIAGTIHSLLGLVLKKDFNTGNQYLAKTKHTKIIENSLIIIDEASMVDNSLKKLINELTIKCKVLYIGDSYQLLPVKSKDSPVFDCQLPEAKLTEIQRQHKDSPIIALGKQLRASVRGKGNVFPNMVYNCDDLHSLSGSEFQKTLEKSFLDNRDDPYANKFLAWENTRVNQINKHIHKLLTNKEAFAVGEYVINNTPIIIDEIVVYATDTVLKVTAIKPNTHCVYGLDGWHVTLNDNVKVFLPEHQYQAKHLIKQYAKQKNWKAYFNAKESMVDLRPVYASTVHKSQGSTYNKVFLDLQNIGKCHQREAVARMLYVAVTRAKEEVFFYGELPAKYRP
jgi:ATP-dependent exoDNAse (exonuclease V) alpha subunit